MDARVTGCFNSHHASAQNPSMVVMARNNVKRLNMVHFHSVTLTPGSLSK